MKKKSPITDLGAIGWIADQDGFELPPNAWTDVQNVRFRNGYMESMPGHLECVVSYTPSGVYKWHWMTHYSASATSKLLVFAGQAGSNYGFSEGSTVAVWDPSQGEFTGITDTGSAFTGTYSDKWTGGVLTGLLVINNGKDTPRYWAGNIGADVLAVPGWDANWRAKSIRPFRNYLVALGITKSGTYYPFMCKVSCAAAAGAMPTSWNQNDTTLDAYEGEGVFADTQDVLIDSLPLGDTLIVYKERSIYAMQYIGAPLVWRFTRLPGALGMIAPNCAVDTPAGHVVLGFGDLYRHQGQGTTSVLTGKAKQWLVDNLDQTAYRNSFLCLNTDKKEVWCCIPTTGNTYPNMALIWNWENDTLTKRALPNVTFACETNSTIVVDPWNQSLSITGDTWDSGPADNWNSYSVNLASRMNLVGCAISDSSNRGVVYALDIGPYALSTIQTAYAERTGLRFDEDGGRYLIKETWPRWGGSGVTASYMPTMGLTGKESPETASGLSAGLNTTNSYLPQRYTSNISGRYFNLRFDMTADKPARIKTFGLNAEPLGQY